MVAGLTVRPLDGKSQMIYEVRAIGQIRQGVMKGHLAEVFLARL